MGRAVLAKSRNDSGSSARRLVIEAAFALWLARAGRAQDAFMPGTTARSRRPARVARSRCPVASAGSRCCPVSGGSARAAASARPRHRAPQVTAAASATPGGQGARLPWLIGALRLIAGTPVPVIDHEARINHANGPGVASGTKGHPAGVRSGRCPRWPAPTPRRSAAAPARSSPSGSLLTCQPWPSARHAGQSA